MSGHDAHGSAQDEAHDAHPAPGLPEVHDEAGDTPMWVPILGLALLALGGIWFVWEVAGDHTPAVEVGDGGVADGEVADGAVAGDGGTAAAPAPGPQ